MAHVEKDISLLKKKLNDCDDKLLVSYVKLGTKLLNSIPNNDEAFSLPINDELVLNYHKLVEERAISTDNILEIKTDRERLIELSKFKKQIGKSIKEDENSILKMKIQFSLLLYKSLKNSNFFYEMEGYNEIEEIEREIQNIMSSNETFTEDKKEAGFLAKFNLNRKIAGNKLKISLLKKNIEKVLSKKAVDIFAETLSKSLFEKDELTQELKDIYTKIVDLENTKKELDTKLSDIEEENSFLNDKMESLCNNISYQKQINILSQSVKDIDVKVEKTLKDIAIEFLSFFIGEDNLVLPEEKMEHLALYKSYSQDILEVSNIKCEISTIKLNIDYCNLNAKKQNILDKINSMNKVIENCEEGIKSYQKRINSLKDDIDKSNKETRKIQEEMDNLKEMIIKEK